MASRRPRARLPHNGLREPEVERGSRWVRRCMLSSGSTIRRGRRSASSARRIVDPLESMHRLTHLEPRSTSSSLSPLCGNRARGRREAIHPQRGGIRVDPDVEQCACLARVHLRYEHRPRRPPECRRPQLAARINSAREQRTPRGHRMPASQVDEHRRDHVALDASGQKCLGTRPELFGVPSQLETQARHASCGTDRGFGRPPARGRCRPRPPSGGARGTSSQSGRAAPGSIGRRAAD